MSKDPVVLRRRTCSHCQKRIWFSDDISHHLRKHKWQFWPLTKKFRTSQWFMNHPWHQDFKFIAKTLLWSNLVLWFALWMGWSHIQAFIGITMCMFVVLLTTLGRAFLWHGCPCCNRTHWEEPRMIEE